MKRQPATLLEFRGPAMLAAYTTAVSLHAHTNRSKETLADVPRYLERIPLVAGLVRREMKAYQHRNGQSMDFTKGWWHPPVGPEDVLESETSHIRDVLGLRPLLSITDHNTIDAPLELQRAHPNTIVPLSLEWTVPFECGFFHLGVHNLRPTEASELFLALSAYTQTADLGSLQRLLATLNEDRETLVVLNHPLWDLAGIGSADHVALLHRFLITHGDVIHALELNGYRSWRENSGVRALADAYGLALIAGGDRHGCAPNSLLNLTTAASFGEFVREIREHRLSVIVVLPEYRKALVTRKLRVAADAVRWYPAAPPGQQRWTDRVRYEREGVVESLSDHWPAGGPLWVRVAMRTFELGTSPPLLPALRMMVWLTGASRSHHDGPATFMDASRLASSSHTSSIERVR